MDTVDIPSVRRYLVRAVTLILDNDQPAYDQLSEAACLAVRDDMGTGVGRDEFEQALRGGGAPGYARADYALAAGRAVVTAIEDLIDGWAMEPIVRMLLTDVLDLGDSAQADLFGEHYLPESADDVDWSRPW